MSNRLVGIILFWLAAAIPMVIIYYVGKLFGSYWFVSFGLIYVLIYRPLLHIRRLLSLGAIEEKDAWKFFIPFHHNRYMKILWFG